MNNSSNNHPAEARTRLIGAHERDPEYLAAWRMLARQVKAASVIKNDK